MSTDWTSILTSDFGLTPDDMDAAFAAGEVSPEDYNTFMETVAPSEPVQVEIPQSLPTPTLTIGEAQAAQIQQDSDVLGLRELGVDPKVAAQVYEKHSKEQALLDPDSPELAELEAAIKPKPDSVTDYLSAVQEATGERIEAIEGTGSLKQELLTRYQREAEAFNTGRDVSEIEFRDQIAEYQKRLDESVEDLANSKIGVDQYWAKQSTGDRILAGIAIALGATAQAMNPEIKTNQALEIIQKAIEQDIESQKLDVQKKQATVSARRGALGDLLDTRKVATQERQLAEAAAWRKVELELKKVELSGISKDRAANLKALQAEVALKVAMKKEDLVARQAQKLDSLRVPGVGIATDPVQARSAAKIAASRDAINSLALEIKTEWKERGGSELKDILFTDDSLAGINSKFMALLGVIKELEELGALDSGVTTYGKGLSGTTPEARTAILGNMIKQAGGIDNLVSRLDAMTKYVNLKADTALKYKITSFDKAYDRQRQFRQSAPSFKIRQGKAE